MISGKALLLQLFALLVLLAPAAKAWAADGDEEYPHPGYLDDVSEERFQVTHEVVIVPLSEQEGPRLMDKIFTQKMSREFSKEFRDRFGYTEFEQIQFTSNRFAESDGDSRLVPVNEYIDKQESFGNYMMKELADYHVNNYLKGSRATRQVYKVKEAISNVEVASASGYKFKFRYKIASNKMTFKIERPNELLHQQIDVNGNGKNPTVRLSYDITKMSRVSSDYVIDDQIFSVRGERRLTETLATSITGQSYKKTLDASNPKQDRVLLGLSWND
jgi:hypothetical protein